tara:strand:+ start:1358 stop:1738 length:381 start_codon:yes stop_codon:yes gene_type:complete
LEINLLMRIGHHYWLTLGCLWTFIVIYCSFLPADNLPEILFTIKDFILHFIAYLLIGFFFTLGTRSIFQLWILLIIGFLLGLGIEIFQPVLSIGRFFSFYDILSNTFGLIFGIILARFLGNRIFTS